MAILTFFKRWSLLVSIVFGTVVYLLFSHVHSLEPVGDAVGPALVSLLPVVMFLLLFVTYCKVSIHDLRPRRWHAWLQAIRVVLCSLLVLVSTLLPSDGAELVAEGVFICVACPTAAAAAVVTDKLGGSIASMTIFTIIDNVVTSLMIPILFPIVERGADISFMAMFWEVLSHVSAVLVGPLALAMACRKLLPALVRRITSVRNLGFYLWCFNLSIVTGVTMSSILHAEVSGLTLVLLLLLPSVVTLTLFAIGKGVGRRFGDSVSAGQAMGQKNTVVGIWLTITFLNPLAALAPGAYVIWQNFVNAWQLWYKDKYGKLRW